MQPRRASCSQQTRNGSQLHLLPRSSTATAASCIEGMSSCKKHVHLLLSAQSGCPLPARRQLETQLVWTWRSHLRAAVLEAAVSRL